MSKQQIINRLLSGNYLYYSSLLIVVFLILSVFCTLDENSYNWFFSSDALYLPSIYKDLFMDGGSIAGWHFNPAPNFFPDMPVYFILMFITGSFLLSTAIFAVIQYVLIIILFRAILMQIMDKGMVNSLVVMSNLLLSMYFVRTLVDHDLYQSFYLLINSYHTSVFTLSLLSYLLYVLYLKDGARVYLALLVIISFLGVLSDQLMFISISFPILIISLFFKKSPYYKKKLLLAGGLTFLSSVLGMLFFILMRNLKTVHFGSPYKMFVFRDMFDSTQLYIKDTVSIITQFNINSFILFLSVLSIIIGTVITAYNIIQKKKFDDLSFYILFSIVFSIIMITTPLINGNYTSIDCYRYNIYPYYLAALNLPLFIYRSKLWFKRVSVLVIPVLLGYYFILIVNAFSITRFKAYTEYYPDKVRSIDRIAQKEGLLKGAGNYWDAKYITMFSKQNVRVYSVFSDLAKYYHVANENWFNADTAIFNFIIDRDMNHAKIKYIFHLDTIMHLHSSPDIIKVPEFIYEDNAWAPVLLDPAIRLK